MYPQRSVMTCGLATALEPPHFNHAPVRGATPAPDLRIRGRVVSIHAPAWGATTPPPARKTRPSPFQSTHPRGVRPGRPVSRPPIPTSFNPRTRVGCDARPETTPSFVLSFNPRTRVGCDHTPPRNILIIPVSIHAPAWGATRHHTEEEMVQEFQSTHPRGVRLGR